MNLSLGQRGQTPRGRCKFLFLILGRDAQGIILDKMLVRDWFKIIKTCEELRFRYSNVEIKLIRGIL